MGNKFYSRRFHERMLRKRAEGYEVREVTEEYSADENGEMRLVKRKVCTKEIPPDPAALKELAALGGVETGGALSQLTDGQLEAERKRLLEQLAEEGGE